MIGQFEGTILGEATTRCELKSGRCRYESGVDDAELRTFGVAGGKVLWAELTWMAPADQQEDQQLGFTTRGLAVVSPTQPQDHQVVSVTGRVAPLENGSVAISADVTDEINAALTVRTTRAVSMPFEERRPRQPPDIRHADWLDPERHLGDRFGTAPPDPDFRTNI